MKTSNSRYAYHLSAIAAFATASGCDYMPEALTGKPSANTPTIHAVGPNGAASSEKMADITAQRPQSSSATMVQKWATENEQSRLRIENLDGRRTSAELVVFEQASAGSAPEDSTFDGVTTATSQFAQIDADSDQGRFVRTEAASGGIDAKYQSQSISEDRTDGVIVINNANLKFVDDLEIAAQADGLIMVLDVDEGDQITAGSDLLQLDSRMAKAELDVAIKELEAAVEKSKDDSEIEYSVAAENVAKEEFESSKQLKARNVETDQEYRKKWLESRRATLAIKVAQLKNKQDVAGAGVSEAKKRMADVQVELRAIKAPFDGVVAEKAKDIHDWVRAGDVIMRLVSLDKLRVIGQVRTDQLEAAPHLLLGAPATVEVTLYPGAREKIASDGWLCFASHVFIGQL